MTIKVNFSDRPSWAERYRPVDIDDVVIPKRIKDYLKESIKNSEMGSLIFYSAESGTGKTTTALALAKYSGMQPLFINASFETSVDMIRNDVINYASKASVLSILGGTERQRKIVILDEAERLSSSAQKALKGIMEAVSGNCVFFITTNDISGIDNALVSRSEVIDFTFEESEKKDLTKEIIKRGIAILQNEEIPFKVEAVSRLAKLYSPDNRKFLNALQTASNTFKSVDIECLSSQHFTDFNSFASVLKSANFINMRQWCIDNHNKLGKGFYNAVYHALEKEVKPETVVNLVAIINDYQRNHDVPDTYIHFLSMMIELISENGVKFK